MRPSLLVSASDADIDAVIRTNLFGVIACTRAAIPSMLRQRRGVILNVSSVAAARPSRGQTVYAATKGAIEAFTRAVAVEYARKGIRCECISPGPVDTGMFAATKALGGEAVLEQTPWKRFVTPEEIAGKAVLLLSGDAGSAPGPFTPLTEALRRDDVARGSCTSLMAARRSVRRFRPEVPDRALIESVLASAVTAPSASNKQPWRFLVVKNRETIARLAAAVRAAVDRVALAVEPGFEAVFPRLRRLLHQVRARPPGHRPDLPAPDDPLATSPGRGSARTIGSACRRWNGIRGLIGTSLALQNLLLAAHAAGLGASGMTGPLVAADVIREILRVPASWHIVALVPVGYADEAPAPTGRKPASQVTDWIE